ncbi:MAG: hypothetical protein KDD60_01710 [Bdellovibrionales bacterium]|nr:hypothetical protein [Bdellovibrionales bacterium]
MSNRDVTGPSANRFEKRFSNGQIGVWRQVNEDLSRLLHDALQVSSVTSLARAAFEIRDGLYSEWRKLQSELHLKREALLHAAEGDQFVKAALYSEQLVLLKARVQATRAALHEVEKALGDTVASYSSLHHFTEGKNVNFGEMNPVMGGQGGDDNLHSMFAGSHVTPSQSENDGSADCRTELNGSDVAEVKVLPFAQPRRNRG